MIRAGDVHDLGICDDARSMPKYASAGGQHLTLERRAATRLAATRVNVLPSAENAAPIAYDGKLWPEAIPFAPLYMRR